MYINVYLTTNKKDESVFYGVLLQWRYHQKILKEGFVGKNDNEVELEGLIRALSEIHDKSKIIKVDTDNKYIYDILKYRRYNQWYRDGWVKSDGQRVAYWKEWQQIRELICGFKNISVNKPFPTRIELLKEIIIEGEK